MNGYDLSRKWFNFSFENPEKVKPIHTAIFFFACEHYNRLGGKEKFGFPSQMTMDAIGVKSYTTYGKALNDLSDWGFIFFIERSKNQYSANIISIVAASKFDIARDKALDKATIKHVSKHCESIIQSTVSIDKPLTNKPINQETNDDVYKSIDDLKKYYLENDKVINAVLDNKENKFKSKDHLVSQLDKFNNTLKQDGTLTKTWGDYTKHFRNWNKINSTRQPKSDRPTDNLAF